MRFLAAGATSSARSRDEKPFWAGRRAGGTPVAPDRKVVVVTFGGGARDYETFMPDGQRNIPRLRHGLIPRGTTFTQVVNRGILLVSEREGRYRQHIRFLGVWEVTRSEKS